MAHGTKMQALDHHALVTTVWLPAGLVAAALVHYGLGRGGAPFVLAAFGVILAAFAGHVVVNLVDGIPFTARELALGLVLYAVALVAFGVATLLRPDFAARAFVPMSAGFIVIFASVVFTMVTQSGARGAFASFDVIRSFRAPSRPADPSDRGAGR